MVRKEIWKNFIYSRMPEGQGIQKVLLVKRHEGIDESIERGVTL